MLFNGGIICLEKMKTVPKRKIDIPTKMDVFGFSFGMLSNLLEMNYSLKKSGRTSTQGNGRLKSCMKEFQPFQEYG